MFVVVGSMTDGMIQGIAKGFYLFWEMSMI